VAVAVAICRADNLRPTVQVLIQSLAGALTQPSICFPLTAPLTKVSSHVNPGDHRRLSMGLFRPEYLRLCHHFNCALGVFEKTPLPHSSAGDITPWLVLSISQRDYLFRSNFTGFIILLRILDTRSPTACPTWACRSERVVVQDGRHSTMASRCSSQQRHLNKIDIVPWVFGLVIILHPPFFPLTHPFFVSSPLSLLVSAPLT
jgi:hypothetical protein